MQIITLFRYLIVIAFLISVQKIIETEINKNHSVEYQVNSNDTIILPDI